MAWYNPFSWGGGPDEVDYSQLQAIIEKIQAGGLEAAGNIRNISFSPNAQDQKAYGDSYGFMRDMVLRDLQSRLPAELGQASGRVGARGLSGSGIEGSVRAAIARQGQRSAADTLSQFGANQAGVMSQMAMQRGQAQVGQNQALWDTILGAYTPAFGEQRRRVGMEEQRIANEKAMFGKLVGSIVPMATNFLTGGIPGMGGAPAGSYSVNSANYGSANPLEWQGPHSTY